MTSISAAGSADAAAVPPPSLLSRLMAGSSGAAGLAVKIALLGALNALALWAASILAADRRWVSLGVLVLATAAIDAVYLVPRRALPAKFLVPATIFLIAFQIVPIVYTARVAFTNYSTGHIGTKAAAIDAIQRNTLEPGASSYTMAPARDADGHLVLVLVDQDSGKALLGTRAGAEPLPAGAVSVSADRTTIRRAPGYTLLTGAALIRVQNQLSSYTVPLGKAGAIQPQDLSTAIDLRPTLRYDRAHDRFVRITSGEVFRDDGRGSFVSAKGEELEPGWVTNVGATNFRRVAHDRLVRGPFVRVFIWTFSYAVLSVVLTFALGLFLAIVLDKAGMRFQRVYRSLLVIPYALPGFISALVWQGLLNDDFGVVNRLIHVHVPWLFDANWAKVSVVLLNLWLGFPYMFLICSGALQAIPTELREAALVDGGNGRQIFRKVTLPLLLVAVAPLLIASFAFNFNNFVVIYLLTGGGPPATDGSVAGSTDILISYTYKLAFASGKGNDYGLATTISILIFFIVGSISALMFRRTRALENLA